MKTQEFTKGVTNQMDDLINQGIKSGQIKRSIHIPTQINGKNGYMKIVENGAIHKILLQQGINPFK